MPSNHSSQPVIRPPVGISACLCGEAVRYDGADKYQRALLTDLNPHVEWVRVCPEVAAGLGVPRPAVELVASDGALAARGRDNRELDVTQSLLTAASEFWDSPAGGRLTGFVFKSRSPSCGLGSTPVYTPEGDQSGWGDGLFAGRGRRTHPRLICVEETELITSARRALFLAACHLNQARLRQVAVPAILRDVEHQVEAPEDGRQLWEALLEQDEKAALGERLAEIWGREV